MAANPALALAVQYAAAGVPVSGCQLRRNLITKPHKAVIMAAKSNRPVHYEAGIQTTPTSLELGSAKRDKTIMAALPFPVIMEGVPVSTQCKLENKTDVELDREDKSFWEGSKMAITALPRKIGGDSNVQFKHEAEVDPINSVLGSAGAVVYAFGNDENQYRWIIAWSNRKNQVNKVYTEILYNKEVNFREVEERVESSKATIDITEPDQKLYSAHVEIDSASTSPILKATLKKQQPTPQPTPPPKPEPTPQPAA